MPPSRSVLATARMRVRGGDGTFSDMRVVCDSGAQANIMSSEMFKRCKLVRQPLRANIVGINDMTIQTKGTVEAELCHRFTDSPMFKCKFVIIDGLQLSHPQQPFTHVPFSEEVNMNLADSTYNQPSGVDAILGIEVLATQLQEGICRNSLGLMAQATSFGWIISGGPPTEAGEADSAAVGLVTAQEVYDQVRKLWEVELAREETTMSADEQACEALYGSTVVRGEHRYQVSLLLKPEVKLGDSRAMARHRLYCLENRFKKNPQLRESYIDFMDEYERLGHMRLANTLDPSALHYYIPHHAVAVDRKFRVVFDASARTTNGRSLNDMQYVGPRLQLDLMDVVMNFRTGQYAVTADICKMFRQIEVQPEHWNLQRILWRKSSDEPIREYWLTVVTYGMTSSPYLAVKTLGQCAADNATEFPRAAEVVSRDFYVDDMLTSTEFADELVKLKGEVIALLSKGGFELAKWRSNCEAIMEEESDPKIMTEQNSTSVLGIVWNYRTDEFQFKVQNRQQPDVITKRIITSEAARIYDPQGYLAPITIRARWFIQDSWREGIEWDKPLSPSRQADWKAFCDDLRKIDQIKIPRWLGTSSSARNQVHIYCDASGMAFGAAAYIRTNSSGNWSARLLCSKSKVTPIKTVTIPRLELLAVDLGATLLKRVRQIPMFKDAPVYMWTDSEIVLHWIRKPTANLKVFVKNRVDRILAKVSVEQIRHVRSKENPADLITRGARTETLTNSTLWWNGPAALTEEVEDWPVWNPVKLNVDVEAQIDNEVNEKEAKFDNVLLTTKNSEGTEYYLLNSSSSCRRTFRVTSYVLRFCAKLYEKIRRRSQSKSLWAKSYYSECWQADAITTVWISKDDGVKKYLVLCPSVVEMENALCYWIRLSQDLMYPVEVHDIETKGRVRKGSPLWAYTPLVDANGLMRIYGRLNQTERTADQKRPIILHRKSTLALQLAGECHENLLHAGAGACAQYLRNKYWIPGIRILTRKVVHDCVTCTRYRERTVQQFMADLPAVRTTPAPAFRHTGVDYAGPITLKMSRNVTTKGYIAVFVCMVYKAVHLELVSRLDSDAFVAALTRFVNLRAGSVQHMYSDNGTNFVKANRELQEAVEIWQDHKVMNHLRSQSIEWHFNTPLAPHHGGLWEAAVKSVKYHLKRITGAHLFTFEEMATLLAKIAAVLNSRPLTPISSDPQDLSTLTPGHFLTGQNIVTPYEGYLVDAPMNRLTAWQKIQKLQQDFQNRWSEECMVEQQRRNKWAIPERSLQVGDLVFVRNELTPPCQWLMGRVLRTFPGPDGRVRTCDVKTERAEYTRPVTKLILLPIDNDVDNASEAGLS